MLENKPDDGPNDGQPDPHVQQLFDAERIGKRGIHHSADADNNSCQCGLQAHRRRREVEVVGNGLGHELKAVVNDQAEDEGK